MDDASNACTMCNDLISGVKSLDNGEGHEAPTVFGGQPGILKEQAKRLTRTCQGEGEPLLREEQRGKSVCLQAMLPAADY